MRKTRDFFSRGGGRPSGKKDRDIGKFEKKGHFTMVTTHSFHRGGGGGRGLCSQKWYLFQVECSYHCSSMWKCCNNSAWLKSRSLNFSIWYAKCYASTIFFHSLHDTFWMTWSYLQHFFQENSVQEIVLGGIVPLPPNYTHTPLDFSNGLSLLITC